jgi:hypothetical protein
LRDDRVINYGNDSQQNEMDGHTAIIQIDPEYTLAINQGPLMGAILFRKREHLSERQQVVRTLKRMALMGPIVRVCSGAMSTQPTCKKRSLVAALYRDDSVRGSSVGMTSPCFRAIKAEQ